jgi:redox-sensitive bicupin YhaK (pirin superfamily)
MIEIRKSDERGHANHGWLKSHHTFSFANYHDPRFMGFRQLRVINEDRVEPAKGFGTHPHENMEIVSYVLDGALEHKDSMGNGSIIRPGDDQRMSAGTGVTHSEFNHSQGDVVHFLQIWILPEENGIDPGYEQIHFPDDELRDTLRLVASRTGRDGSVSLHQDADLYATRLSAGASAEHSLASGRYAWVQVARGSVSLNGQAVAAGDGAAVSDESALRVVAQDDSEVLVFDLS